MSCCGTTRREAIRFPGEIKQASLTLAGAYAGLGAPFAGIAARMRDCGRWLEFQRFEVSDRQHDLLHLKQAQFCRGRLCPACQVRLARRQHARLCQTFDAFLAAHPGHKLLMLTLTQRTVALDRLRPAVTALLAGFRKLMRYQRVRQAVVAWYRTLEITRNDATGEYHAHLHVVLCVPPAYFDRKFGLYIDQARREWTRLWRKALRVDYDPVVDIRRLTTGVAGLDDGGRKALAEVTKYVTKPSVLSDLSGHALEEVHVALKGRRLVAASKNLRGEPEQELADTADDEPSVAMRLPEGAVYLGSELYRWHGRWSDYLLVARRTNTGGADDITTPD